MFVLRNCGEGGTSITSEGGLTCLADIFHLIKAGWNFYCQLDLSVQHKYVWLFEPQSALCCLLSLLVCFETIVRVIVCLCRCHSGISRRVCVCVCVSRWPTIIGKIEPSDQQVFVCIHVEDNRMCSCACVCLNKIHWCAFKWDINVSDIVWTLCVCVCVCVCVCASMGEDMLISLHPPPLQDKAQKQDVNHSKKALLLSDTQRREKQQSAQCAATSVSVFARWAAWESTSLA